MEFYKSPGLDGDGVTGNIVDPRDIVFHSTLIIFFLFMIGIGTSLIKVEI